MAKFIDCISKLQVGNISVKNPSQSSIRGAFADKLPKLKLDNLIEKYGFAQPIKNVEENLPKITPQPIKEFDCGIGGFIKLPHHNICCGQDLINNTLRK